MTSQEPKAKQQQKDDLPDVSLVVPEDASPELKAILKANALALNSKRLSERLRAAQALGELGEKGKPVRGLLCRAMLRDPVRDVRVAAADALKNIDSKMHYLAVALLTEENSNVLIGLLAEIQKLEDDGAPLAPLVADGAIAAARYLAARPVVASARPPAAQHSVSKARRPTGGSRLATESPIVVERLLIAELNVLCHIARNDLAAYKLLASALTHRDEPVRATAVRGLARMKHGKLAVPKIIALLKTDTSAIQIAAIETLAALADESTEEKIADTIHALRYHKDAAVRQAVETALNKLENKKQKP